MADITKCNDQLCPSRKKCYRFTAPANEYRQSYFMVTPREQNDVKCIEFLEIRKRGIRWQA